MISGVAAEKDKMHLRTQTRTAIANQEQTNAQNKRISEVHKTRQPRSLTCQTLGLTWRRADFTNLKTPLAAKP